MADPTHCPGLVVVELRAPAPPGATLPTEVASALADQVAGDLARLVPGVSALDLAVSGALLDPAQVLRPGWPVFAELGAQLARQPRGAAGRVVAFGSAGGRMVSPLLEPESALGTGALVVLPFVLAGDADTAQRIGMRLEEILHEHGLAGAGVALLLAQALGLDVAHARYFTHRDLAALVAIQLEHAGCAPAWSVLEAALFDAGRPMHATAASGQRWALSGGAVRGVALGFAAWRAGPGAGVAADALAGAFAYWQAEQRRYAALFAAHGLDVAFVDESGVPLAQRWLLQARGACTGAVELLAHEAAGLGAYAFSATWSGGGVVACYPLAGDAVAAARDALRATAGAADDARFARTQALPGA